MNLYKEYDSVDRDIIFINKDSLMLRLVKFKDFCNSSNSAFGFSGIALALLSAGYLTETFHNVGFIPGETVRTVFLALGIVSLLTAGWSSIKWSRLRNGNDPEHIISGLMQGHVLIPSEITPEKISSKPKKLK